MKNIITSCGKSEAGSQCRLVDFFNTWHYHNYHIVPAGCCMLKHVLASKVVVIFNLLLMHLSGRGIPTPSFLGVSAQSPRNGSKSEAKAIDQQLMH